MKLIDTNTGREIKVGVPMINIGGGLLVKRLRVGLFRADIYYSRNGSKEQHVRMPVRYMHPSFMFQRIVFFPS